MKVLSQRPRWIAAAWSVWLAGTLHLSVAQTPRHEHPIIPYPTSLTTDSGQFIVDRGTKLVLSAPQFRQEAEQLQALIQSVLGKPLASGNETAYRSLLLSYDTTLNHPEAYRLAIAPSGVRLAAATPAGMFRAVQTLRQLMPVTVEGSPETPASEFALPALTIDDQPAYDWRGLHLDVSRHFFSTDYLKKLLDLMALYKFNKFHLHLTDDQGWRMEIKHYPKLTEEGAWRTFNQQDSVCMERSVDNPDMAIDPQHTRQKDGQTQYGGFYTQDEMKEIIRYAAARHIEIIPEIDMPGHMSAAIQSYKELSCAGEAGWGDLFSVPICPCSEYTYAFAENVFSEIIDLFPSPYIHLGADEVDKTTWEASERCQDLMKQEGLANGAELQSYFVHRMQKFFASRGKKLIGWDDMLEGGIDSSATVMYWRSWVQDAPQQAARNGNDIIMSPVSTLYFDYPPDKHSVEKVYHFNPVPEGFQSSEAAAVLGAQANLWTEYVPTEARADYLYFPRATALAEALWSGQDHYQSYLHRLSAHYPRLNALKVRYRLPDLQGFTQNNVFVGRATLTVDAPAPGLRIYYTRDGQVPTRQDSVLESPLTVTEPDTIKLVAYADTGLSGDRYTITYRPQTLAAPTPAGRTKAGLRVAYFPDSFKNTAEMQQAQAADTFTVAQVTVPKAADAPSFGLQYRGYLDIPETGIYSFYFTCDDGGFLRIAGRDVVDNDGLHSAIEKTGQAALQQGLHPFALDFVEGGGGFTLRLMYCRDGGMPQPIPASWFRHVSR